LDLGTTLEIRRQVKFTMTVDDLDHEVTTRIETDRLAKAPPEY
jgi:hypothetical protein